MSKKRFKKISAALPWTVHLVGILAGLALLTPLLPAGALGGPVLLKGNLWQILTLMAGAVWLTLAAGDRRYRPNLKSPLVVAYLAWLAFLLISLPFSDNPSLSFWSSRDRVLGVMAIIHWCLWLIVLSSTLHGWRQWRPLLAGSLGVAVLSALIGLAEVAEYGWYWRMESTQGNAIYLSSYLLLHVFIALILLARSSGWPRRLMYAAAGLVMAWGVVQTGTRAALIAMLFGLLMAGLGYFLIFAKSRRQARRWSLVLAVVAVLILAGGVSLRLSKQGQTWGLKHLPTPIHRFIWTDFGSDRLSLWAIGLRGWQDRPWLGYGLENYSDVLNHYVDVERDGSLVENWYDRTHNHFLDMLLGTGLIGLLFYLAVWLAAFWTAISGLRRAASREDRITFWLIVPLLSAHAIAIAVAFETPSATMVVLMVMALAVSLRRSAIAAEATGDERPEAAAADWITVTVMMAIALTAGWWLLWRPYRQAVDYNYMMATHRTQAEAVAKRLTELFEKPTYVIHDLRYNMVSRLRADSENLLMERKGLEPLFALAAEQVEETLNGRPNNFKALLATAYVYRELATFQPEQILKAADICQRSIEAGPNRPEGYEEMAEIEIVRGDLDAAWDYLETALAKSRHDESTGRIRMRRAAILALTGKLDEADKEVAAAKQTYDIGRDMRQAMEMAEALKYDEQQPAILGYLKSVAETRPHHPIALSTYAVGLLKNGQREAAKQVVDQVSQLDAESADILKERLGL